jgi:hypothetical protein
LSSPYTSASPTLSPSRPTTSTPVSTVANKKTKPRSNTKKESAAETIAAAGVSKAHNNKKKKRKQKVSTADKIRALSEQLASLRQQRKQLFPAYEAPRPATEPEDPAPPVPMEVDLDAVMVATAHSPYLVPPDQGYSTKILTTNVQLKETVGANAGTRLRDVAGLPYDLASAQDVYLKEVMAFRARYTVRV